MTIEVCFLATQPNASHHFCKFIPVLKKKGISCRVIAKDNVKSIFTAAKIQIDQIYDDSILKNVKTSCGKTTHLVMDVDKTSTAFCNEVEANCPEIVRAVYSDNYKDFVSGGYSEKLKDLAGRVHMVLFANVQHAANERVKATPIEYIDFTHNKRVGIGLYLSDESAKISLARKQATALRKKLLEDHKVEDKGQHLFTYLSEDSSEDDSQGFSFFLEKLKELAESQQSHPLAHAIILINKEDEEFLKKWLSKADSSKGIYPQFIVSDLPTHERLALSKGVFYQQTTLSPELLQAEIPYIVQIAPQPIADLALRFGALPVADSKQLMQALSGPPLKMNRTKRRELEAALGKDTGWQNHLLSAFKPRFSSTSYYQTFIEKEGLLNEVEVELFVNKPPMTGEKDKSTTLSFRYGNIDLDTFSKKYRSKGWRLRKVFAIPVALYAFFFKTIYHLALALLLTPCKKRGSALKQLFACQRDIQEAFGWLMTLFNDRIGSYHLQDSAFHKTCYEVLY